ncbi:thioredoxin family protein [Flavisericum labens]|uniref:thioredoxin family protein n=1 Tax=Flavisericum labens TaxID=3377112 RepID=UPI00387AF38A
MKNILFTLFFGVLFSFGSMAQERIVWHTNMNKALELAQREDKKMMLFFTGSDWCGWCIKLQKEVFKTSDFEKWSEDVVLVELDFPKRTEQDQKIKEQNYQLQRMFQVKGYPSVYFVNPKKMRDGKINLMTLGKTGYIKGGAKKWIREATTIVNRTI